jgi:hypothetical protein
MQRFVAKVQADGARGLVLVPLAFMASYWPRLVAAARPIGDQSFVHIRNPETVLIDAQGHLPSVLAVFAVDFGPSSPRCCDSYAPSCGQERAWRGRPLLGHSSESTSTTSCRGAYITLMSALLLHHFLRSDVVIELRLDWAPHLRLGRCTLHTLLDVGPSVMLQLPRSWMTARCLPTFRLAHLWN